MSVFLTLFVSHGGYHQLVMFQSKYVKNIEKCQKIFKTATFSFADAFAQIFSQ